MTGLKQLNKHCLFGGSLNDALKQWLVSVTQIQRQSLMEAELTPKCAVDVAISKVPESYNNS